MKRPLEAVTAKERAAIRRRFWVRQDEGAGPQGGWTVMQIAIGYNLAERDVLRILLVGGVRTRLRPYIEALL